MGLFDHLFKSKSPSSEEDPVEVGSKPAELAKQAEETARGASPQRADPSAFLHPKSFVPRGVTPLAAPVKSGAVSGVRKIGAPPAPPAPDEIVLTLGDVLSRIPTPYLKPGQHDPKREMRFSINDLSSDIARGRAAVPLSRIAQLVPDIFVKQISRDEDTEVRLPLQKLVEQIGLLRARPQGIDRASRPTVLPSIVALSLPLPPPELKMEPEGDAAEMLEPLEASWHEPLEPAAPIVELKPLETAGAPTTVAAEHVLELKPADEAQSPAVPTTAEAPVAELPQSENSESVASSEALTPEPVDPVDIATTLPEAAKASSSEEKITPDVSGPDLSGSGTASMPEPEGAAPAETPELNSGEPIAPDAQSIPALRPAISHSVVAGDATDVEAGDEKIQLSLVALLRRCPREIIVGELPTVPDHVRITLPFAPIDRQLVYGHVEISAVRFVAALPVSYQKFFSARMGVKVPIPLEEIFQNLPPPVAEPSAKSGPALEVLPVADVDTVQPSAPLPTSEMDKAEVPRAGTIELPIVASSAASIANNFAVSESAEPEEVSAEAALPIVPPLDLPAFNQFAPPPPLILTPEEPEPSALAAPVAPEAASETIPSSRAEPEAVIVDSVVPVSVENDLPTPDLEVANAPAEIPHEEASARVAPNLDTKDDSENRDAPLESVLPEAMSSLAGAGESLPLLEEEVVNAQPIGIEAAAPATDLPMSSGEAISDLAATESPASKESPLFSSQAVSAGPPDEPIKITLPPQMARPFIILPPAILGFKPSDDGDEISESESPQIVEPESVESEFTSTPERGNLLSELDASASFHPQSPPTPEFSVVESSPASGDESEPADPPTELPGIISIDFAQALDPSEEGGGEAAADPAVVEVDDFPPTNPADLVPLETPVAESPAMTEPLAEKPKMRTVEILVELAGRAEPTSVPANAAPAEIPFGAITRLVEEPAALVPDDEPSQAAAEPQAPEIGDRAGDFAEVEVEAEVSASPSAESDPVNETLAVDPGTAIAEVPSPAESGTSDTAAAESAAEPEKTTPADLARAAIHAVVEPPAAPPLQEVAELTPPKAFTPEITPADPVIDQSLTVEPPLPPPLLAVPRVNLEPIPAEVLPPPALPLRRWDQDALQALFMTEENLDLAKISRLAAQLPGVHACVIATRDQACTGGTLPEGFDLAALLGLAPRVGEAAGRLPIGGLKHFTLYGEQYSVSFFERNGLSLCAVHRPRSFVPGVREKLVAIADELSK